MEALFSFVTRVNEVKEEVTNTKRIIKVRPLNPTNNEEAIRKSFNVMEIFLNPMNDLDTLLHERLAVICKYRLSCFLSQFSERTVQDLLAYL
jgi:hypothetical protein